MKSFLNGVAFLALLIACNVVAAITMWSVAALLAPLLPSTLWPWFLAGILGVAVAVYFLIMSLRLIGKWQRRDRARAPA